MKRDENQNIEYKENWQDKYLAWICGYANAQGGTLYFGIEDETKKPVGVKDANSLMETIPNKIRDTMGIVADVALLRKGGKDVIRIKVIVMAIILPANDIGRAGRPDPPSATHPEAAPYQFNTNINPGQHNKRSTFPVSYHGDFHYRSGAVRLRLTGAALTQFLMERSGLEWDACPSTGGYLRKDFTFIKLKNRYKEECGEVLKDSDFISFGLAAANGVLTNTGILMADECPVKHSRLFCTRWNGCDMTAGVMDATDDLECGGGLLQLLKSGEDFIRLHSRNSWHKRPQDRVNFREYPERAVSEGLINALVHRDYLEYGSEVHIDMFDDRLEITSPGGMPGSKFAQDYPNARRIPSRRRNKNLADLFDRIGLMERKGSGFKKMFEDYESLSVNLGRRVPILESDTDFFRLTLPNLLFGFSDAQLVEAVDRSGYGESTPTVTPTVNLLGVRLLGLLKEHGELSPMELRTLLKIRDRADFNERYLRPCLAAGFIEQTIPDKPTSRFQKYRLTVKGHSIT